MNVKMEKIDNVTGKITVSIEENDYQDKVIKELKEIGRTHVIDGFRKGQVPVGMLKKKFGKNVLLETINKVTYDALLKYIEDNKINILGEPIIENVKQIDFDKDKDFSFNFEVGFAPVINVTVDKKITVPYYNIEVDEEMIKTQQEHFDNRFGKQVPGDEVDAKALVKGAMKELNEDGTEKEDGLKVEKTIVSPEYFKNEDQKKLFLGKKLNDKVVFNPSATCDGNISEMASMLNVDKAKADIKSNFEMEIQEIIVLKKAEHNQELYDSVFGKDSVKNEDEYVAKLKELIANQLVNDSNYRFTIDSEEIIKKQVGELELPVEFLKKWLVYKTPDKYNAENVGEEVTKMLPHLQWQLIKEQLMGNFKIEVKEEDVLAIGKMLAAQQFAQYGMTNIPEETLEKYAKEMIGNENYRQNIINRAVDEKLFAAIKNAVTLDNKNISAKDFNKLFEEAK